METGEFDLVLMDIQMPVMDGYEATQKIQVIAGQNKIKITDHCPYGKRYER